MREIKFRAWDKLSKIMYYHGNLENGDVMALSIEGEIQFSSGDAYQQKDFELMQYTGLKDRNGKEIYEGDLLQDNEGVGEVEWVQEHCAFLIFTRSPSLYHKIESDGILKNTEVIGIVRQHMPSEAEVDQGVSNLEPL